jgi:hypothetical protein
VADAEVQQCYRVSPGPDFPAGAVVPDMAAYHALVQRLFTQDANVRNVKAFFSVHRAKFEPGPALADALVLSGLSFRITRPLRYSPSGKARSRVVGGGAHVRSMPHVHAGIGRHRPRSCGTTRA